MTKGTGGSALKNQKGTAAAQLVLPGDDRIVPGSVGLDEAMAIFGIDIAAEFPVALFGFKLPKRLPEARDCDHRKSAFDQANDRSVSNNGLAVWAVTDAAPETLKAFVQLEKQQMAQ